MSGLDKGPANPASPAHNSALTHNNTSSSNASNSNKTPPNTPQHSNLSSPVNASPAPVVSNANANVPSAPVVSNTNANVPSAPVVSNTNANLPSAPVVSNAHTNANVSGAPISTSESSVEPEQPTTSSGPLFHTEPYKVGKFVEPPFVKPVHFSDIDQWKFPERNYYIFVCISFVLGFFGMDHFYLRSFGTGTQKFIFNILSLGFWWWWDVLQIVTDSNKVKAEGLTTPFDWIRGVGRGVFEDPIKKAEALETGGKIVRVKKDLFVYALLTMFFGLFGADKFYMGEQLQGIAKLLSVFNLFTFLFGLMWVIWDIIKVFFYTESLMKDGISAPPPFSMLFPDSIKAEKLFSPEEVTKEQLDKEAQEAASNMSFGLPIIGMDSFRFWYKELAVPLLQPSVGTAVKTADKTVKLGEKAAAVGGEAMATGPKIAAAVTQNLSSALNPTLIMEQVQQAAADKAASRVGSQQGGSRDGGLTSGPIIAGTLMAVVLAGAGKFILDIVTK